MSNLLLDDALVVELRYITHLDEDTPQYARYTSVISSDVWRGAAKDLDAMLSWHIRMCRKKLEKAGVLEV